MRFCGLLLCCLCQVHGNESLVFVYITLCMSELDKIQPDIIIIIIASFLHLVLQQPRLVTIQPSQYVCVSEALSDLTGPAAQQRRHM